MESRKRCRWCGTDPLYQAYHDTEWGMPLFDDQRLFELLILEGMQAGLSWYTVLRKRAAMRQAFADFDPKRLAGMSEARLTQLMGNPNIIRHRLKIQAVRQNARAYLALQETGQSFTEFLWGFMNHQPQHNAWTCENQVPTRTAESDALATALKKYGFRFVGGTICYAFMQAAGMVNDHVTSCFRYQELVRESQ